MALKLSKSEENRLDKFIEQLGALKQRIDDGKSELEQKIQELVDEFNEELIKPYNDVLQEAYDFVEDIGSDRRSEYDDKSERWQEGDRGQAASEWVDSWENAVYDLEQVDELRAPSIDDHEVGDHVETLENLSREMEAF